MSGLFVATRIAVAALIANATRSALTALGVVVGVAAVIAMVSIGLGARAQVAESFASLGSDLLVVSSGSSSSGWHGGAGSRPSLTWDDLAAMKAEITGLRGAAPVLRTTSVVQSEDQTWSTTVTGTTPVYLDLRSWATTSGRRLDDSDVDGTGKVAMLGQTVVDKLYGGRDPVGLQMRAQGVSFEVIGVLAKKGESSWGQDYDDVVLIPSSTFQARIQSGGRYLKGYAVLGATNADGVGTVERQVTALLRSRHKLLTGKVSKDDDFQVRNLAEYALAQEQGTDTVTNLLATISAIALLVGGIGIMNIMLVSVAERTREIGLRMAVGAKPGAIMMQFLVEAVLLAGGGGVAGVILGGTVGNRLAVTMGWPMRFDPLVALGVVAFSGVVGVGFGLYPAWTASRLDPVDALRSE